MTLVEKAAHFYRTDVETIENFAKAVLSTSSPISCYLIVHEFLELHIGKISKQTVDDVFSFLEEYRKEVSKMTELKYVRANYCSNRDVATGKYECPYADVVNNTICCTGHECNYRDNYKNLVVNNTIEDEDDECLSCPYFNPEAPDCCTYAPEACYYDADPDTYPF